MGDTSSEQQIEQSNYDGISHAENVTGLSAFCLGVVGLGLNKFLHIDSEIVANLSGGGILISGIIAARNAMYIAGQAKSEME